MGGGGATVTSTQMRIAPSAVMVSRAGCDGGSSVAPPCALSSAAQDHTFSQDSRCETSSHKQTTHYESQHKSVREQDEESDDAHSRLQCCEILRSCLPDFAAQPGFSIPPERMQ